VKGNETASFTLLIDLKTFPQVLKTEIFRQSGTNRRVGNLKVPTTNMMIEILLLEVRKGFAAMNQRFDAFEKRMHAIKKSLMSSQMNQQAARLLSLIYKSPRRPGRQSLIKQA
jgi:hypothetical protein